MGKRSFPLVYTRAPAQTLHGSQHFGHLNLLDAEVIEGTFFEITGMARYFFFQHDMLRPIGMPLTPHVANREY